MADRFQAGGAVRALSGGVWAGAHGGDGDTAAGVGARACSRGGAGGRDGVRGGPLPCDPGRRRAAVLVWRLRLVCIAMRSGRELACNARVRADLQCEWAQTVAGHTMSLLPSLPADVVGKLFADIGALLGLELPPVWRSCLPPYRW